MAKQYRSGEAAPQSGIYEILGVRGGHTGIERTAEKGERLPPTLESGQSYRLAQKTKTK